MSDLRLSQRASHFGVLLIPHKAVNIDTQGVSRLETSTGLERISACRMNLTVFGKEGGE